MSSRILAEKNFRGNRLSQETKIPHQRRATPGNIARNTETRLTGLYTYYTIRHTKRPSVFLSLRLEGFYTEGITWIDGLWGNSLKVYITVFIQCNTILFC